MIFKTNEGVFDFFFFLKVTRMTSFQMVFMK